jgi:biuret amidohydrolase
MTQRYVAADPYPWPYNGDLRPENTALIVIDMQTDFCGIGGYVDRMGYDLSLTRAPIMPIAAVVAQMRRQGFHIFHTREGHRPDLADLRKTNAGAHGALAPASATRARAAAYWCAASRAGRSFPN